MKYLINTLFLLITRTYVLKHTLKIVNNLFTHTYFPYGVKFFSGFNINLGVILS